VEGGMSGGSSMYDKAESTKENLKERSHFEDFGVDGRIILK
jgi:hypothetical protein